MKTKTKKSSKYADELAAKLGIDRNSPHRARAAVQYSLQGFKRKKLTVVKCDKAANVSR